jgi:uncharacterized sulfatase
MDRREFIKAAGLAVVSAVVPGCKGMLSSDGYKGIDRPNIIVILADDLGYGHFAANMVDYTIEDLNQHYIERDINNGDEVYDIDKAMEAARESTRYISKLAAEGVRLTNAYVPLPLCAPSRCAFITARYPQRYGGYCNTDVGSKVGLAVSEYALPQALKEAGYTNGIIGKWHLQAFEGEGKEGSEKQHPLKRGFDYYFGFNHSGTKYWNSDRLYRNYDKVEDADYTTDIFTREAVGFIEKNKDRPFLLYLAYNAVHGPLHEGAPEKYMSRFNSGSWMVDNYNAYMAAMDDGVGAVLDKLQESGIDEKTLVIFFSDNGPGGNRWVPLPAAGPLRGCKGHIWQGGLKISMVARWPGVLKAGLVYRGLISSMDILPTAIAISGSKLPEGAKKLDGRNMLPALQGKSREPVHETLFFAGQNSDFWGLKGPWAIKGLKKSDVDDRGNAPVGWAVRKGDYMLRYWGDSDSYELYNVVKDKGEKNNIIGQKYVKIVEQMKQEYKKWFAEMTEPNKMNKDRWRQLIPKY